MAIGNILAIYNVAKLQGRLGELPTNSVHDPVTHVVATTQPGQPNLAIVPCLLSNLAVAAVVAQLVSIAWPRGAAPLGYGDANGLWPRTTNSFGPAANNKYITTYFRRGFLVADVPACSNATLSLQRDASSGSSDCRRRDGDRQRLECARLTAALHVACCQYTTQAPSLTPA